MPVIRTCSAPTTAGRPTNWVLPEPWTLLTIALGGALVVARRPLARLFAGMLGRLGLHATVRHHRLARAFFTLTGATWTIGGIVFATIFALRVTPA